MSERIDVEGRIDESFLPLLGYPYNTKRAWSVNMRKARNILHLEPCTKFRVSGL
jgi:ribosomal protein L28